MNPWLAGVACRCPRCGRGRLYSGFLKVARGCPLCGASFDRADTGRGGGAVAILLAGGLCGLCVLAAIFAGHPPPPLAPIVWLAVVGVLALVLARPCKGVRVALRVHANAAEAAHAGR